MSQYITWPFEFWLICVCMSPQWRLDCNRCSFLVYLPPNLHSAKVLPKETCQECGSRYSLSMVR